MSMRYNSYNYQQTLKDWDTINHPTISDEYMAVRKELETIYDEIKSLPEVVGNKYQLDLRFGVALKEYFEGKEWFNLRLASNIDFWRYMSVYVLPHVVFERWDEKSEDRYWRKPARIWLRSIWWFAYIGWAETADATIQTLGSDRFNTDIILNTVERTGRKGTHIETYRHILHIYSSLESAQLDQYTPKGKSETLFRAVMKLNTAKLLVFEPSLCKGGAKGYAKELFESLGVDFNISGNESSSEIL